MSDSDDAAHGLEPDYLPAITAIREVIMAGEALRLSFAAVRDLGVRETTAMSNLRGRPGMSQHELAGVLGLSPAAITSLVDRLEAQGLARRSMSPSDRRVTLVSITQLAEDHLDFAFRALQSCVRDTPGITEPHTVELLGALARRMREQAEVQQR